MGKRGNSEGSIYPVRDKDGKVKGYRGAYTVHTASGVKRRYLSGRTRSEVSQKLTKAMSDRDGGLVFEAGTLTVGEYLDRWLTDSVRDTVRGSTFDCYEVAVRRHIKPALGRVKLSKLTPAHVQGLYRDRLDSGLAPASVNKLHVVLHKALKQAVEWNMIPRNATEAAKAPRPNHKEIHPLDREQVRALLQAASEADNRLETLYVLAVTSGMRQGELLALKWEDVDLDEGVIHIRRTLTRNGGRISLGKPKTPKSRRSVRLTAAAVEALKAHLSRQMEEMKRLGDLYQDQGLIFTTETGAPINPSNLRQRSFNKLLKRAGLPQIRFHDLRHTCATLLLGRNVNPKIVSEMLGHANISITLDTYSHVLPNMQESAIRALEDALS